MTEKAPVSLARASGQISNLDIQSLLGNMLDGFAHCRMIATDGVWDDFFYIAVNPAFETLTGLTDVVGKKVSEVIPGLQESNPALFESYARVAAGGKPERLEIHIRQLDCWLNISVYNGGQNEFVALFDDITNRKQQERLLRENEARYRAMFDEASVGFAQASLDGTLQRANQTLCSMLGFQASELEGRSFLDAIHAGDRPTALTLKASVLDQSGPRTGVVEMRLVRKDGSVLWAAISFAGVRNAQGVPDYFVGVVQDISERRRSDERLQVVNRALRLLTAGNEAVVRATDEAELLRTMTKLIVETGGYMTAWVGLADADDGRSVRAAAHFGSELADLDDLRITWTGTERGQGPTGTVIRTGTTQANRNTWTNPAVMPWRETAKDLEHGSSMALPMTGGHGGGAFGILNIHSSRPEAFDSAEMALLEELANDLAYGITSLRTNVARIAGLDKVRHVMESAVATIAATIEARDPYTAGHQRRVAQLAEAIGGELGLDASACKGLHFGALIHDVGKVQIPAELLAKPTRLSRIEFELIKTHTRAGFDILKGIEFPWPVALMVLQHHERMDGSGYPDGLTGDAIALESRILAVADVMEAYSSHRPYRPAHGTEAALTELERGRGTLYDAAAVDACVRLFHEKGFTWDVERAPG